MQSYYVSYRFTKDGNYGFGRSVQKIEGDLTLDAIVQMENDIAVSQKNDSVIVLNIIPISEGETTK